jgi:hypothetical protein
MYIEDLFLKLADPCHFSIPADLQSSDISIVYSISAQIMDGIAFTESQANLALRLIKKYQKPLTIALNMDLTCSINNPVFRFPIRSISYQKSLNIIKDPITNNFIISLVFPFDNQLLQKIREYKKTLGRSASSITWNPNKKSWDFYLREEHIDWINNNIIDSSFIVDDSFNDYVLQIESIKSNIEKYAPMVVFENNSFVFKNVHQNMPQPSANNLIEVLFEARKYGINIWSDYIDQELDRAELPPIFKVILQGKKFETSKLKIDDLRDLFVTPLLLFPILVVIPGGNELTYLKLCKQLFEKSNILPTEMSVLFRLPANKGAECNTYIKENNLNNPITNDTKVVFISEKIPKTIIKSKIDFGLILKFGISGIHCVLSNYIKNHHFVITVNYNGDIKIANM